MTVNIAARIGGLAGPSEVLVSSTVRDLVVGSDLRFVDAGAHELKGVPGERHVFRVAEAAAGVPNPIVRGMALFDPGIRSVVGDLGKKAELSNEKAKALLGWSPRPLQETIVDCAQSLIREGVVGATAK